MKDVVDIIKHTPGLLVKETAQDGGMGVIYGLDAKKPNKCATVVWSNGGGWDHVSVSWTYRCPTWREMCRVKDMFFREDEMVVQYHPKVEDYVNFHPHCLHMWKKQDGDFPCPPTWMVGPRDGQSVSDAIAEAEQNQ